MNMVFELDKNDIAAAIAEYVCRKLGEGKSVNVTITTGKDVVRAKAEVVENVKR